MRGLNSNSVDSVLRNELWIRKLKFKAQISILLSLRNLPVESVDVSAVKVASLIASLWNCIHFKVLLVYD